MLLSHGCSSRGISGLLFTRMVLVPNYRIIELFFSHGASRRVTVFLSRIIELIYFHTENLGIYVTNYRIVESLFTRKITEVFFVTRHVFGHEFARLVLGPTDQREVIVDFFFTRNVTDGRGGYEGGTIEA